MGACHTADNAYFQLLELKEDRLMAIDNFHVAKLRADAQKAKAIALTKSDKEWERLEGEADLLEISNAEKYDKALYDATMDEIAFIESKLADLEPLRKYKDMPLVEAHEASQREAWKFELIKRAENYLLTAGVIPPDHFATMRLHPDFEKEIIPKIQEIKQLQIEQSSNNKLLE